MSKMKSPAPFIKCELAKIVQSLKFFFILISEGYLGACMW